MVKTIAYFGARFNFKTIEINHFTTIELMCLHPTTLLQLWNIPDSEISQCYILLFVLYNPLSATHTINQS